MTRSALIRVALPYHLRILAQAGDEVTVAHDGPATQRSVLDALEAQYPMLRGTIRDHQRSSGDPFCASSPAGKTVRTSRLMPRCLPLSPTAPSRF